MMWKNIEEPASLQMTIWLMHIACWTSKATHTHLEYVIIYCFSTATVVPRTSLSAKFYVNFLSILDYVFLPLHNKDVKCFIIYSIAGQNAILSIVFNFELCIA